jgi:hypothetical protein
MMATGIKYSRRVYPVAMVERNRDESTGQFAGEVTADDVVAAVRAHDPAATSEIGDELGVSRQAADRRLRRLRDDGRVSSKKIGASLVWFMPRETGARPAHVDADAFDADDLQGDASTTLADDAGARAGESDAGDVDRVALPDDVPSGVDGDAARDAIDAAREFVRTDGPASAREIVAAVMPAHALGYDVPELEPGDRYRGAWWCRIVKPGLDGLDDVVYRENHQDYAHADDVDHD